jgi:endonuclease I
MIAALAVLLGVAVTALAQDGWNDISLSDSVVAFGTVSTGQVHSAQITVTNNSPDPVTITSAEFEEDVFSVTVVNQAVPVPPFGIKVVQIYFETDQNVDYTDFLRIELDGGVRSLIVEVSAQADHPGTYYDATQNKWAEDLKTTLTGIIDGHNSLGYTPARDQMYGNVDNDDTCSECPTTGCVECVYTGRIGCFNTRAGATSNNFNCEHTWPQSFFSENEPMRSDLYQIAPCDAAANTARASLDFGVVVSSTWSVGGSKKGTDSTGQEVFEPRDAYKGNVARGHFYFIIRYSGNYVGYTDPAKMEAHFRDWHVSDPVDAVEEQRNEDVYALQYNRNPFIDHPEFVDRISSFFGTAVRVLEPEIAVSPLEIDMGSIDYDTTAYHYIAVMNTGTDTLHISSIASTNPDFDLSSPGMTLPPDTYDYVRVGYDSGAIDRLDSTVVQIASDDSDEGLVEVPVMILVGSMSGVAGTEDGVRPLAGLQNYPNPFSGETTLSFHLEHQAVVGLDLYNVEGRLVSTIIGDRFLPGGMHRIEYDGSDLPSGVYFCRLSAGEVTLTRRMLLLKE